MTDCLFCRIAQKELEAKIVYEDEQIIAIHDRFPKAPVHVLVMPKQHIVNLFTLESHHQDVVWHLMMKLKDIARMLQLDDGFRTVINSGEAGGQSVFHMHAHILGGGDLPEL